MAARNGGNATPDSIKSDEQVTGMLDDAFQGHKPYGEKPPEERKSRTRDSRAGDEIHEAYGDMWNQSGLLDTSHIPARAGFVQRWVRTKMNGVDDPKNVMKRMNQGYRPRLADTVPAGTFAPTVNSRQFGDIIGMDGIILMERPAKLHESHARHNREMAAKQMEAVNGILNQAQEPGKGFGPVKMNASSQAETGHRPAPVADED
jgi:hypothetical protein